MKKLGLLLIFSIFLNMLIADGTPPEGTGTEANPYQMETLDNLLWLSTTEAAWDSIYYFLQTSNIDASDTQYWNDGEGFDPIGYMYSTANPIYFQGSYDGDNHIIDSLFINRPETEFVGLFGAARYGLITNLGVTNLNVTGESYVGGIAGYCVSIMSNCYASGCVNGTENVGALNCYYRDLNNSYYNYDTFLINGRQQVFSGALTSDLFSDWMENGLSLEITDYLDEEEGYYLIDNAEDFYTLLAFNQYPDYSFKLTSDIDIVDYANLYIPFFLGIFDGDGYVISNLSIDEPEKSLLGLFGSLNGATINNIGVINASVNGLDKVGCLAGYLYQSEISFSYASGCVTGNNKLGVMAGYVEYSSINDSYSTGDINGSWTIGGLTGHNHSTEITNCRADVTVSGEGIIGGLCGCNLYSPVHNSYAQGTVSGESGIGGLTGVIDFTIVTNSYATCDVIGSLGVGGLLGGMGGVFGVIGENILSNSYATGNVIGEECVGGLVGSTWEEAFIISNCIWNVETSGQSIGLGYDDGGTITNLLGKTTAEMQVMNTYTDIGWDFAGESTNGDEDIWDMNDEINDGYPFISDIENPVSNDEIVIENVKLKIDNYPNPFNPITNIRYELTEAGKAKIDIYNLKGQKVETLLDDHLEAGKHSVIWNADNFGSGMYLVRYQTEGICEVKKIILLK